MIRKLLWLLLLVSLLFVEDVRAQSGEVVLLLKPQDEGGALQEAFNRLRGELSLHGFVVEVANVQGALEVEEIEGRADDVTAVASVWFAPSQSGGGELSRVDVWIGDRVSGTTVKRTIVPGSGDQGPSVLALRTLELLRSSLRGFSDDQPDKSVEGAHPERAQEAVRQLKEDTSSGLRLFLSAGLTVAWSLPDTTVSLGPQFGLGVMHDRFAVRLISEGPLLGGRATHDGASFEQRAVQILVEPMLVPVRSRAFSLLAFGSIGAAHLHVNGQAQPPYSGRRDSTWVAALGGGIEASLRFSNSLEFFGSGRMLAWLPAPVVTLASSRKRLGAPQASGALGLRLFF